MQLPAHPPTHPLSMPVLMTPDTTHFSGNVHGGSLLKLLSQVACLRQPLCRHLRGHAEC